MTLFDEYSVNYRNIHNKNLKITGFESNYFAENKVKIINSEIGKHKNIKILDIGCGDGILEEYLGLHMSNYSVTGIDVSEKSIEVANSKNIPFCKFVIYDGMNIKMEDNSVNLVILSNVMHHVDKVNQGNLVKEINRVLCVGGSLVVFEHNPINPFTQYLVKTCELDRYAKLIGHRYLSELLIDNNFVIKVLSFISFFPNKGIFKHFIEKEHLLKNVPIGGQYYIFAEKNNC